jgi:glycosyltransferase involved in cell wall biosynthesis
MYDGGYRERFHLVDLLNKQSLSKDLSELIWVEYYNTIESELKGKKNIQIIKLDKKPPLFVSYCWNEGIRRSLGDILIMIDADVTVPFNFLEAVLHEHERNDRLVMYFFRPEEPEPDILPSRLSPIDMESLQKASILRNPSNYGGCLTVRKKWLMRVNGYEQFPCFAGNVFMGGRDLYTRFKNLGLDIKWHPSIMLYHPWHPTSYSPFDHDPEKGTYNSQAQREVIRRRELSLDTLPYQGIDKNKNKDPAWWNEWTSRWEMQHQQELKRDKNILSNKVNQVRHYLFSKFARK